MTQKKDAKHYSSEPDLSDHIKRKNRLIAPWNRVMGQSEKMQISSWHISRLPEVIWIGEIQHGMGDEKSLTVLEEFIHAASEGNADTMKICPELAAFWGASATEKSKRLLVEKLQNKGMLASVQASLSGLLSLYPQYPLCFLGGGREEAPKKLIDEFSSRMVEYMSRFSVRSVKIHSHIMMSEIRAGKLHFPSDYTLPDISSIYSENADPESETFKNVAGHIRALVGSKFAFYGKENLTTGPYFWNRGLVLTNCIR